MTRTPEEVVRVAQARKEAREEQEEDRWLAEQEVVREAAATGVVRVRRLA